jgi:two-component system cell cycle sensor histidine kinase/response regulator CckA
VRGAAAPGAPPVPPQGLLSDHGLSGPRLAETLLAIRPDVTVMFMSGYNEDTMLRQGVMTHGVAYLQKPFTPASLLRRVRLVLEQRLAGLEKDARAAG